MPAEFPARRADIGPFAAGDWVVYTPNLPDLPPIRERRRDIGRIVSVHPGFYLVDFVFCGMPAWQRVSGIVGGPIQVDGGIYYALTALPEDIREELPEVPPAEEIRQMAQRQLREELGELYRRDAEREREREQQQQRPVIPRLQIPPVDPNIFN